MQGVQLEVNILLTVSGSHSPRGESLAFHLGDERAVISFYANSLELTAVAVQKWLRYGGRCVQPERESSFSLLVKMPFGCANL